MKTLILSIILVFAAIQMYEGSLTLSAFLLILSIIALSSIFIFKPEDDTLQKIQDFCYEYDINEYKTIAKVEASKLKSTYGEKLTYDECFQHINDLNIYCDLDDFNTNILKSHIANYYYNIKG